MFGVLRASAYGVAVLSGGLPPGGDHVQPQHPLSRLAMSSPYPSPASQFLAPRSSDYSGRTSAEDEDYSGSYASVEASSAELPHGSGRSGRALLAEHTKSTQPPRRRLTAMEPNAGFPTRPFAGSYTMIGHGTCVAATGSGAVYVGAAPSYPGYSYCRSLCDADSACRAYEVSGYQNGVGGDGNCMKFEVLYFRSIQESMFEDKGYVVQ